jgi:hypothetical protein
MASTRSKKTAEARRKALLVQMRQGVYGVGGYPLNSPVLKRGFKQVRSSVARDAAVAKKLYVTA